MAPTVVALVDKRSTDSTSSNSSSGPTINVILGSVIGGVIGFILLSLLVLFSLSHFRRRRASQRLYPSDAKAPDGGESPKEVHRWPLMKELKHKHQPSDGHVPLLTHDHYHSSPRLSTESSERKPHYRRVSESHFGAARTAEYAAVSTTSFPTPPLDETWATPQLLDSVRRDSQSSAYYVIFPSPTPPPLPDPPSRLQTSSLPSLKIQGSTKPPIPSKLTKTELHHYNSFGPQEEEDTVPSPTSSTSSESFYSQMSVQYPAQVLTNHSGMGEILPPLQPVRPLSMARNR
ncbi:hypothetical protein AMATHDRAFT_50396 [Amanita thiersii Skay4041]|uniref:Uncharacterized protein n=1 Tax=Amanita thiersii Skay4041 TaxID=703135 RepID=A0A2A9NHY9_9AGAR|nr:hypothetical protein AMATHDRAFT_50396 [Amanita thiersii Skay4041]